MYENSVSPEQMAAVELVRDEDPEGLERGIPAAPIAIPGGALPLRRLVGQGARSAIDYALAGVTLAGALVGRSSRARVTSAILGGAALAISAMSDTRLGVAKLIPIEAREKLDHAWGGAAIALPFALGYWRTASRAAIGHVAVGTAKILLALVTDYRATRGVGRRLRVLEG
jgi:hypothetical protein